jgi:aspartyl-tRNA(Asn)/glutamyl-tRNA(Gln) amidotransferase subunit C
LIFKNSPIGYDSEINLSLPISFFHVKLKIVCRHLQGLNNCGVLLPRVSQAPPWAVGRRHFVALLIPSGNHINVSPLKFLKASSPCDNLYVSWNNILFIIVHCIYFDKYSLQEETHMKMTRDEVEYVANLARLHLEPDEADKFTGQLGQILDSFEKLSELDTKDVTITRHAIDIVDAFRDDKVRESYDSETALQNAPDKEGSFFKVPKIIE